MIAEKPTPSSTVLTLAQGLKTWAADQTPRPMVRQTADGSGARRETVGDASDNQLQIERRLDQRHPARHGASAEIRRWGVGSGTDFAEGLLDLSIWGVRVQLKRKVQAGDRFEVTLWSPNRDWCIRCMGVVRWSKSNPDGNIMAGLRLSRPIAPRDFEALVGPI